MIRFTTVPLKHEGVLRNNTFRVPASPSTEEVLNVHAKLFRAEQPTIDPELELYNFVADTWPFITLNSR